MSDKELWADETLLTSLLEDDEYAFKQIYKRYAPRLYAAAYNLFRDKPLCEDLIQELFADLWIKRKNLNIKSLKPYLYTSAKNRALMAMRSGRTMLSETALEKLIADYATDDRLNIRELNDILNKSIDSLPDKCREIFRLSRNEHLSNKEIAERLNISIKTVENQMTIALRKLREQTVEFFAIIIIAIIFSRMQ
ncbi:RNA polymerase sigma-70 factor [Pedobacter sp.]|uniref:RNA polymerase sigma-70 factor n=1 Tax=Pedobacter sp. TaxID=1411316 RepID=UPI00396CC85D